MLKIRKLHFLCNCVIVMECRLVYIVIFNISLTGTELSSTVTTRAAITGRLYSVVAVYCMVIHVMISCRQWTQTHPSVKSCVLFAKTKVK